MSNQTTGIFTNDFLPEDQPKAKTYECVNCSLVSEFNYCIDCNHCICTECLKTIKKCPADNRIIDENTSFSFNFIGNNLLEALKLYCIYKNNGCPWEGTKKQLEEMHYNKCQFKDNKRKLENINMNNFNIFENNNNVINNVEEHINNATKMILRKKPKRRNFEFDDDDDLDEESSYSNFSQEYLGKDDEESLVEVDSDDEFRKNKYNLDKKLITKTKEKFIDLDGNDNNVINFLDDEEENKNRKKNEIKIIKIDGKNEIYEINEKDYLVNKKFKNKRLIEIENDIKMRELIKKSSNKMDVVQLYADENYNDNVKQKDFVEIMDINNFVKPKKNIISLEEDDEIIDLM